MPIFKLVYVGHKLVLVKCLQYTLVKIIQWSCKTTFWPRQKQLRSQQPVSVHVSLKANELLPTPPLCSVSCIICGAQPSKTKKSTASSVALMSGENKLLSSLLHPTTKRLHCSVELNCHIVLSAACEIADTWYYCANVIVYLLSFIAGMWTNSSVTLKEA